VRKDFLAQASLNWGTGMRYDLDKEKWRILKDFLENLCLHFAICNTWLAYYAWVVRRTWLRSLRMTTLTPTCPIVPPQRTLPTSWWQNYFWTLGRFFISNIQHFLSSQIPWCNWHFQPSLDIMMQSNIKTLTESNSYKPFNEPVLF